MHNQDTLNETKKITVMSRDKFILEFNKYINALALREEFISNWKCCMGQQFVRPPILEILKNVTGFNFLAKFSVSFQLHMKLTMVKNDIKRVKR